MGYQAMKKYGGILNTDYYMKETSLKRPHTVSGQTHAFWKRQNYAVNKKVSGC